MTKQTNIIQLNHLGWNETENGKAFFAPYDIDDDGLDFELKKNVKHLCPGGLHDLLQEKGDRNKWEKCYLKLRAKNNIAFKFATAASFAAPMFTQNGDLSAFVCNIYGEATQTAKAILRASASIWNDPDWFVLYPKYLKNKDVEDFASSINNIPIMFTEYSPGELSLSDMENVFCFRYAGDRAGTEILQSKNKIGANFVWTSWFSRLLQCRCDKEWSEIMRVDANRIFSMNCGFAGKEFVSILKKYNLEDLKRTAWKYGEEINNIAIPKGKFQEHGIFPGMLLLADELAEKYIFKDGIRLTKEELAECYEDAKHVEMQVEKRDSMF